MPITTARFWLKAAGACIEGTLIKGLAVISEKPDAVPEKVKDEMNHEKFSSCPSHLETASSPKSVVVSLS